MAKLKTRLYRVHLVRTINYYQENLAKKFGPAALSEAQKEVMRQDLEQHQNFMKQREKTVSWQIPLQLEFFDNGSYQITAIDESNLLFLDD